MLWLLLACSWVQPIPHLTMPPPVEGRWLQSEDVTPAELRCEHEDAWLDCFTQVPGATWTMGAQAADPQGPNHDPMAQPNEAPRRVTVPSFRIQRIEVAASKFKACVRAGHCSADGEPSPLSTLADPELDNHPTNEVTWFEANQFCDWLGARLPTEEEWELAARGAEARRFPWGDEERCGVAADGDCASTGTVPFSALRDKTPLGIMAMAGSVWEWTSSKSDGGMVTRGGGWKTSSPHDLRSSRRRMLPHDHRAADLGFRCVRTD